MFTAWYAVLHHAWQHCSPVTHRLGSVWSSRPLQTASSTSCPTGTLDLLALAAGRRRSHAPLSSSPPSHSPGHHLAWQGLPEALSRSAEHVQRRCLLLRLLVCRFKLPCALLVRVTACLAPEACPDAVTAGSAGHANRCYLHLRLAPRTALQARQQRVEIVPVKESKARVPQGLRCQSCLAHEPQVWRQQHCSVPHAHPHSALSWKWPPL